MGNGIDSITEQVGKIGKLSTGLQNTFGINATNGYDQRRNTSNFNVAQAKDSYTINNYDNRSRRDDNSTTRDDNYTELDGYKTNYFKTRYSRLETNERLGEINDLENGRGNNYPQYRFRGSQQDQMIATGYNNRYNNNNNNNRPAPYNNIDGILTAQETRRGLDNAGITSNPAALQDFAADLQAISGQNLTYICSKTGKPMLSMDRVAAALTEYARNNPQINMAALEAGDPNAWQALDAFLDSDAQRFGRGAGNTIGSNAPVQNPSSQNQTPTSNKTYKPDEKISQRIGELIGEELEQVRVKARQEGKSKQKIDELVACEAQKISNQIAAGLQAKGIKVQGNPIDELSGYIASEKPKEAEALRNGTKLEAAKALRQATGDLDAEAKRALTIARVNNTTQFPNANTTNQGVNNNVSNPAQEERMLLASLERGQSIDKVSDIKQHLNKLTGSKFKDDDNVNEAGFITKLNQTLKQNLDSRTYNDILNGGAFTVKGTFELIEKNMGNRAEVEQNRKLFEEGFKDGAAKQIINATLNDKGQDGHIKLQQDLRKIGYDSQRGLEGSLKEYLSDKLYNQGNFQTAPESVQKYIKDVEAGKYKDGFPLTDPQNAAQMREVVDYVQDSVNLDLAKKERGLPVGKSANLKIDANSQQKPNAVAPIQSTNYERTLGTEVNSGKLSKYMQETSDDSETTRLIKDIATASRNNNPQFVKFHKDFAAKHKTEIEAEIARQNKRNEIALQNLKEQQEANQPLDAKVNEQKAAVSKNPPSIVSPNNNFPPLTFVPPVSLSEQKKPTEQKQTTAQQPTNVTPPSNSSNAELVDGINKLLVVVPADQKGKIAEELQKRGIKVEPGKEAEAIAEFVQKNYPEKIEALKKGEMGAAMSIIQELQKQAPTPTPVENKPQQKTEIANNPMERALNQFKTEVPSTSTVSTVIGGQEANNNVNKVVGVLPVDMRKPNAVGSGIGA